MNKSNKLVFFGNERLATGLTSTSLPTIKALIAAGYEIAAIVSNYTEGQSRNSRPLEIAEVAKAHNIPLLLPEKLKDIEEELKKYQADAGVLVAYGKIIPKDILKIFPKGIINIHPSLLPKYRGPTPIEHAILDGATETGVSIMLLTPKMDEGPVFAQERVVLSGDESKTELAEKLLNIGAQLLIKHLPNILDGSLKPTVQDDKEASYTKLLNKKDGRIDWSKTAQRYEREVRAYSGFPRSKVEIEGYEVTVTKAKVGVRPFDRAAIVRHCKDGSVLEILELIAPSGRVASGADFLRGYMKS